MIYVLYVQKKIWDMYYDLTITVEKQAKNTTSWIFYYLLEFANPKIKFSSIM